MHKLLSKFEISILDQVSFQLVRLYMDTVKLKFKMFISFISLKDMFTEKKTAEV